MVFSTSDVVFAIFVLRHCKIKIRSRTSPFLAMPNGKSRHLKNIFRTTIVCTASFYDN